MVLDQPWTLNMALSVHETVSKGSLPCVLFAPLPLLLLLSSVDLLTEVMVIRDPTTKVFELLTLL